MSWCSLEVTKCSVTEGSEAKRVRTLIEFSSADPSSPVDDLPLDGGPHPTSDGEEDDAKDRVKEGKCDSGSGSVSGSK